jgi:hypothetical protein
MDVKGRKAIDCRKSPSEKNCSLRISGTESEVLDAAVMHACAAHGHKDTPELRAMIRAGMEDDSQRTSRTSADDIVFRAI